MPDLYLKKCICPFCLKTTETKRVLSRHIRVASTDFDGFVRHQGVNVYLYEPIQCSHCRFFFHESFGKLSLDVRATLQDHILPTRLSYHSLVPSGRLSRQFSFINFACTRLK
ncbi:DUF2225 domain-containing protein [Exiguobacterium sp. SL14]|nr:DUF2225 domain-containing protein [Exiguobacterium sp. SL14]MCY1690161.1 DUF2225 domain-containing protein [Exiguobacterium sp. SL14]